MVSSLRHTSFVFLAVLALLAPGCLYEPLGFPRRPYPRPRPSQPGLPMPGPPRTSRGRTVPDYGPAAESGDRAAVLLADEIGYQADVENENGSAPESPGLTALRMAAEAADFVAEGKDHEALELLERAVAIGDFSGFAYLYLARVHFREGSYALSDEFLSRARPLLPDDRRLRRSLDGLQEKIRERMAGGTATGS